MKFLPLLSMLCLLALPSWGQAGNFTAVDQHFTTNQARYINDMVCLVKVNGRTVYYRTLGAQRDTNRGYLIASGTKTITAAVMLRLAQEGILDLDAPISRYLPQSVAYGKGSCTIRQCFSHTGGWSGTLGEDFLASTTVTLAQGVDSILKLDPWAYQPGTRFKYGGVGMQVGGYCGVVASNTPWSTLFASRIKSPLRLDSTTYRLASPANPRLPGGIRSNARDMLRFAEFIRRDGRAPDGTQVVDSIWMQEFWRDQTNRAPVLETPYPIGSPYNNPYNADTIRYGFGSWQDVYNPTTSYTEQISGDGATGVVFWVDRCRGISAAIMTTAGYTRTAAISMQAIDLIRTAVGGPGGCGRPQAASRASAGPAVSLYPSPAQDRLFVRIEGAHACAVRVFGPTGKLIATTPTLAAGESLSTTSWPTGLYIIEIVIDRSPPTYHRLAVAR